MAASPSRNAARTTHCWACLSPRTTPSIARVARSTQARLTQARLTESWENDETRTPARFTPPGTHDPTQAHVVHGDHPAALTPLTVRSRARWRHPADPRTA